MFFRKYKKIKKLESRVSELEEILCPFNRHDWIEMDWHVDKNLDAVHHYKCRRCKKYIETSRSL